MATATQMSNDLFDKIVTAWESAVESGMKMQEESAKWMQESSTILTECYKEGQAMAGETIAKTQESIDETMRVLNQQAESGVKFMQKTINPIQNRTSPTDAKNRFSTWWEAAMEAMSMNSQAILKANSHIISTWSDLARKINGVTTDSMSKMAKKTAEQADRMAKSATKHAKEMAKQAS